MAMLAPAAPYQLQDRDLLFKDKSDDYVFRFKDMPDSDKPRERLLELGPNELSLAELLAIVWGVGTQKEDVLTTARRTLKEYGEKTIGNELDPRRLSELANIPLHKACQVVASFELGRRFYARKAGRPMQVRNSRQAYQYVRDIGASQKEQLRGLYLNSQYQVIHDEVISVGSLTSNVVHPREVFQPAIEHGAAAIILAHNHPSGKVEPSLADIEITDQLMKASEIIGIELLDHIIVTKNRHISMKELLRP